MGGLRSLVSTLLLPLVAAGAAWLAGLGWFAGQIPREIADGAARTEAIVVLTGGSERLSTGLDLLAAGLAGKLFVSGVYRGIEVAELLKLQRRSPHDMECCIEIGYQADDTQGNASETAHWMAARGFSSLRLVTAHYHMPRSLLEFRHALPRALIVPHPVFPVAVMQNRWWTWPGTARLIVGEYHKYLLAQVRLNVYGWFADGERNP